MKFKQSFAQISNTIEHKKKCSEGGKKVWKDQQQRENIIKAVKKDNATNPKKAAARTIALSTLRQKPWFLQHMNKMRLIANIRTRSNIEKFIVDANVVHDGFYNYSLANYINSTTNITIICPKHGQFQQTPHSHLQGKGCSKCATIISNEHQLVLNMLDNVPIHNNTRDIISPYEIDIWLPDHKIGIEINGEYWHGVRRGLTEAEKHGRRTLHITKTNAAVLNNIKLLQFWGFEIIQKSQLIHSMINHALGKSYRIYARQCTIQQINNETASIFFNNSHLQGHRPASITYALTYNNKIVCALSFSKHHKYEWEIMRYACEQNMVAIGGFSRLFTKFIKEYNPTTVMTFADRRISCGNLYSQFFKLHGITKPNYFYMRNGQLLSRQQCQKHKLHKLLSNYNEDISEVNNMLNNGYIQLFDCGHLQFIWQK